ncbi:MAG: mechanosensitive ion channel family protein, partial [candidate division Zixibacteria bacterium]|nr:mechanosensitive ion channel family protein [candidate division Zixibacteria bacterium]
MEILNSFIEGIKSLIPAGIALIVILAVLLIARFFLTRQSIGKSGNRFRIQATILALSFAGILIIIIVLPIDDTLQGQLLSLIGILLTAAIALSSTTFVGNIMAGM